MVTASGQVNMISIPIRVSLENRERLLHIGLPGQTFNGIVTMLLDFWHEKHN